MLQAIKIQKGQLWRPENISRSSAQVSVRIVRGIGWVTSPSSVKDIIYRTGEIFSWDQKKPLILALSEELDLEVEVF